MRALPRRTAPLLFTALAAGGLLLSAAACESKPQAAAGATQTGSEQPAGLAPDASRPPSQTARAFLDALLAGQNDDAVALYDDAMAKALPAPKLEATWKQVIDTHGAFHSVRGVKEEKQGGFNVVLLDAGFQRAELTIKIVVDDQGRVTGLWFSPPRPKNAPDAQLPTGLKERRISFGETGWPLEGTLTTPDGDGPFVCVVLVHGSGPHDRDESIGPNKPFKELAHGLATRGLAVFRYDKRTFVHAQKVAARMDFTVDDETVTDALSAVAAMRTQKDIRGDKVFVLGHSLGGMMAPRIGERDPKLGGLIILAGNTRKIEDVIIDQLTYMSTLPAAPVGKEEIEKLKVQAQAVKGLKPDTRPDRNTLLFGIPLSYWLDLKAYDPVATAQSLELPIFAMQGGRDYQVTDADYQGWVKALTKKKGAMFKQYANLNHLFHEGTGKATPSEYEKPASMPANVFDDIAAFVRRNAR